MCNYFSAIVTRDLKVHWSKKTCRHEDIIAELKLADTKLVDRDFVRVEITPNNKEKLTRNRADWTYKVDEDDTVPAWYKKAEAIIQASIWVNWSESAKTQIVIDSESIEVTDTYLLVQSSSKVVARGSSKVVARGSSTVEAWDYSKVEVKSSNAVALCHGKIIVNKQATVIIKESFNATEISY
jgi:hypothetical protein